ncbi:DNA methyltransferase [Mycoplasma sp. 6243]|uniref:DNA methyltransferase n=1 Tax=Mycoplasma sp. 6243 TaxID=3440865 RepID=UPI003EBC2B29
MNKEINTSDETLTQLQEKYLKEIDRISSKELNTDQKRWAAQIIKRFNDNELEYIFQFIAQRIKIGFRFDVAPESNNQSIALLKKNEKLSFKFKDSKSTDNCLIIGENYDALKNLIVIEREAGLTYNYDVIYIDPPYNTESSLNDGNKLANDKENVAAKRFIYRDKYTRNGWLNMMNERLKLAKKLLKDDGVIFVSIDDNEQAYLKVLMDEIFGEENFVENFIFAKTGSNSGKIRKNAEYVLSYVKNIYRFLFNEKTSNPNESDSALYSKDVPVKSNEFPVILVNFKDLKDGIIKKGKYNNFELINDIFVSNYYNTNKFTLIGKSKWSQNELDKRVACGTTFMVKQKKSLAIRYYEQHSTYVIPKLLEKDKTGTNIFSNNEVKDIGIEFNYPKPSKLIKYLTNIHPNQNARILDFFAGSGTTGHAVLDLNREDGGNRTYTLVTNNQNEIAKSVNYERLYRINKGNSTDNQTFEWINKNKPYKTNLNVYDIEYIDVSPDTKDETDNIIKKLIQLLKDFGIPNLDINNQNHIKNLLNNLLSLNPQER